MGLAANADAQEDENLRRACSLLTNNSRDLENTTITSTEVVEANSFKQPGRDNILNAPAFCRVVGVSDPAINFEVWLPLAKWNGKYNGVGNGGMAGVISHTAMAGALNRGYATASTDTGHERAYILCLQSHLAIIAHASAKFDSLHVFVSHDQAPQRFARISSQTFVAVQRELLNAGGEVALLRNQ